ncbi:MAG: AMP-dependent synthetase, partial [Blastocatellia bacterium]|nr:AMP-dependent synthetase [Blastocatellia bacterium]
GVPDEKWGETPIAVVVLRHPEVDSDELRDWINARVHTRYQRVQKVVIMEEFPRNSAGKILKRVMREPYWSDRDTKI